MGVKEHILSLLQTREEIYIKDPRIIIEDYRKEQEKIEEYNGRQLLELLQNADDAAISANNKCCHISLNGNKLIVANNGDHFTKDGIESLMYSNLSPKMKEQNKIGQKGLGFRSVLSWANKVTIKSADFAVEFSKDIALDFLQKIKENNPVAESIINDKTSENENDTISILRCPKVLDVIPLEYSDYDTYIVIELKDNQKENVIKQIKDELDMEVLLFLNNLETISVDYPDGSFTLKKETNGDSITISRTIGEETQTSRTWHIKTKSGTIEGIEGQISKKKNYEIKIAWTDQLDDHKNTLYSYFRTNVKFPFPALVHATFDLTSDRNHLLPSNGFNEEIKASLKDFMIGVAASMAAQGDVSYKALKLLCVEDNDILSQNDLVERIKETNPGVFPTVANKYISYTDNPVFLRYDYASFIVDAEKKWFKSLLQFSGDSSVVKLLECLGVIKAPNDEILSSMSEMTMGKKSRAQLISWLTQEKYGEDIPKNLVQILIDTNGEPALPGNVVFLPPSAGPSLAIPNDIQLKIMDSDLYEYLKGLFYESKAESMESRLRIFGVKAYRFGDIFRILVQNSSTLFDKDFILKLYDLYIKNKDGGADITIPSHQNISVLNRNGDDKKTTDVYLGEEYGCSLCEQLYQYDQQKFVASPDKLGLDGKDFVNDFLVWLGVADKPRYITINLNGKERQDYSNYVLDNYPFSEKDLWGYRKKRDFSKDYIVDTVKVTSIDEIEQLLNNGSNETILWWLLKDERIVNNTKEPERESCVLFHKHYGKSNPTIDCNEMPSYLQWKLSRAEWMETINNQKVAPGKCCISKSITDDFSPLIEIPQIDYSLLKGFDKHNIEYVLHKIGVKTEIKDFSLQEIYSILAKLPEFDSDGKKARLLYRELVEKLNEDDIDENSPERNSFIESGKVFCKNGNGVSYKTVNGVYYLQDKIYGENIVCQFDTIAIDRRRNSTLIKRLFGVEPLANLKFSLKGDPKVNDSLNADLQKELHNLTPYVYALRSSGTKDVNFSKLGDEWSVQVCSEISPVYKKKDVDDESEFVLNDYEFVYVSEKNIYYVLIKDSGNTTLSELKSDYKFVDIVSEIYSNILKVDSIRSTVSRLFEADTKKRDHILQTEVDYSVEKLKEARKQLNIVNDQKVLFWLGVLETLDCDAEYKEYEKTELERLVEYKTKIHINDYSIDYNELASEDCSVLEIKKLFEVLRIDIESFNHHSSCNIDLVPYFKNRLAAIKNDKERLFEQLLYEQLKDKTIEDKKLFISSLKEYRAFRDFKIDNSIHVDLETILNEIVSDKFKVDLTKSTNQFEIKSEYDSNYNKLKDDNKPNWKDLKAFLDDNDEARSLVYFAEYDVVNNLCQEYWNEKKTGNENLLNGIPINGDDLGMIYQVLIHQPGLLDGLDIENVKTEEVPSVKKVHERQGGFRTPIKRMSEKRKKDIGFIGEALVYQKLKGLYKDVSWDSGYAKEVNENTLGDDMYHYDIKYKKGDEYYYVEVKSTVTDNLEFEISESELEFGKEKKKNYEIFIVTNVENENPRIKNIGNPFIFEDGESLMNCSRFTVLNDSFTIKMKEKIIL